MNSIDYSSFACHYAEWWFHYYLKSEAEDAKKGRMWGRKSNIIGKVSFHFNDLQFN